MENMAQPSGFLLIDKPAGWTSFDVVAKLRGITHVKKIGHAGTLDPFATGLLVVAIGSTATKQLSSFVKQDKVYEATFVLGDTSTTHDPEGVIAPVKNPSGLSKDDVIRALKQFTGTIEQIPPMHSAVKIGGKKLYELARKGKEIERAPRTVTVRAFDLVTWVAPLLTVRIMCSSGTYVRALARDVGDALGVGAYVKSLRRTRIGSLRIEDATPIDRIAPEHWQEKLIALP